VLDEQMNFECESGLCSGNEIVAGRIKNKW
jgi:hypothetical protein